MRSTEDQQTALECLKLALAHGDRLPGSVIENAGVAFAFVTGCDADYAKRKLDAVLQAIAK